VIYSSNPSGKNSVELQKEYIDALAWGEAVKVNTKRVY